VTKAGRWLGVAERNVVLLNIVEASSVESH